MSHIDEHKEQLMNDLHLVIRDAEELLKKHRATRQ